MAKAAVYDTKPYDRQYLLRAERADQVEWHFHDF